MFPYTQERELPDEDIKDIADTSPASNSTKMPTLPATRMPLTRLLMVEGDDYPARAEGDIDNGKTETRRTVSPARQDRPGRGSSCSWAIHRLPQSARSNSI